MVREANAFWMFELTCKSLARFWRARAPWVGARAAETLLIRKGDESDVELAEWIQTCQLLCLVMRHRTTAHALCAQVVCAGIMSSTVGT